MRAYFFLALLTCLLLAGCNELSSTNKHKVDVNDNLILDQKGNENKDVESIVPLDESGGEKDTKLYRRVGSFKSIYETLVRSKTVYEITWAPTNNYVVFAVGNPVDGWGYAYAWNVGEHEPIKLDIPEERISKFSWSPNGQFVLLDVGTSPARIGYVINANGMTVSKPFTYMGAIFSSDSKFLLLSTPSDHNITDIDLSPSEAYEISLYNNQTQELQVIVKTDDYHNLYPTDWIDNETIGYRKVRASNHEEEEITYHLRTEVKQLEIQRYDEDRSTIKFDALSNFKAFKDETNILPYYLFTNSSNDYVGEFGTLKQGSEILEATLHVPIDQLIETEKVNTKLGEGILYKLKVSEAAINKEKEPNSPYLIYVHVYDGKDVTGQYYSHHLIYEVQSLNDFEESVKVVKSFINS